MTDVIPTLIAIGGWIGAAEFLLAYFLVSKGRIAGDSLKYQALNLSASVLLPTRTLVPGGRAPAPRTPPL